MTTYIALLRGINVSGQKLIRMANLKQSCVDLMLQDVRTYLQSGNVVFCTQQTDTHKLAALLRDRIAQDFGHAVEVLVLSEQAFNLVANANPLRPLSGGDEKLFHVTFLSQPVSEDRFQTLKLPLQAGEQAILAGQVIFLYCPHGYGKTKLSNGFFEKALGVSATTRNWRTMRALVDLCTPSQKVLARK